MKILKFDAFNTNEAKKKEEEGEDTFTCSMCDKECTDLQTTAEHTEKPICKKCAEECDVVSTCCQSPFAEPGWPENDICGACGEHTGAELVASGAGKTVTKKLFGGHKVT